MRRHGKRFRGEMLDLRIMAMSCGACRIGIVVPRHAHTAVARNRVKRRLREILRVEGVGCRTSVHADIVVYALPPAYASTFGALRDELVALGQRAGI